MPDPRAALTTLLALALCCTAAPTGAAQHVSEEAVQQFLLGSVLLAVSEHPEGQSHPIGLELLEGGALVRDDDPGSGYSHPRVYAEGWALEAGAEGVYLALFSRAPEAPRWRVEALAGDRLVASVEHPEGAERLTLTRSELAGPPVGAAERDALVGVWTVASVAGPFMGDEGGEFVWPPDAPAALYSFGGDGTFELSGEGAGLEEVVAAGGEQQGRWVLGRQEWDVYSPLEDDRFAGPLLILAPEPGAPEPEARAFVITELGADTLVLRSDGMRSLPVTLRLRR